MDKSRDLLGLLDARENPAATRAWLDHVPDFIERFRRRIGSFTDQAGEMHADDVTLAFLGNIQNLGIDSDNVGLLVRPVSYTHLTLPTNREV